MRCKHENKTTDYHVIIVTFDSRHLSNMIQASNCRRYEHVPAEKQFSIYKLIRYHHIIRLGAVSHVCNVSTA